LRDLILEEMTDLDDVKERCLAAEEQLELARELLEAWTHWYGNPRGGIAPSPRTKAFLV